MDVKMSVDCPTEMVRKYAAGEELDLVQIERMRSHMLECQACQSLYRSESALTESLRSMTRIAPPSDFSQRVLDRIRSAAPGLLVPGWNWQKVAATLALVVLLSGLALLLELGLQAQGYGFLDSLILSSFTLFADALAMGLKTALALGDIIIALFQASWWILRTCSRGLIALPPVWLFLLFFLFTVSHGVLFWMLRNPGNAGKARQ